MVKIKKTVSILGCGWLGTALGRKLMTQGYNVKGSTATAESYVQLETTGIDTYHLKVEPEKVVVDYTHFFNTDVLVICFPPKRNENVTEEFPKQIKQVARLIEEVKVPKVLFVSSTAVYESTNREVREGEEGNPEKPSGKAILEAEKILTEFQDVQTTVVRFGGLIGYDRNPARFLSGKKDVPGNVPVNLIHRNDAVNILTDIIQKNVWGEVFNACSPQHPTKKEFYAKAAEISEKPVPDFSDKSENHKVVNSDKLINRLGYSFEYPSPMDYLKEWQEWIYRI